MNIRKERLH
jgi:hypothetical protein